MSQEGLNGIFKGAHVHAMKHLVLNAGILFIFSFNCSLWLYVRKNVDLFRWQWLQQSCVS